MKTLSFMAIMVAITGMMGISFDQVFAEKTTPGVGKGGFQLNLIGVDIQKGNKNTDDGQIPNDDNNGHRIFVNLNGQSKIFLQEDTDQTPEEGFAVIDADATDKDGAIFQLPPPNSICRDEGLTEEQRTDPEVLATCNELETAYGVYARILGKPEGNMVITSCADTDLIIVDGVQEEVCSTEKVDLTRNKGGKPVWENVSRELLTVCVDIGVDDGNGGFIFDDICDMRVDIFDDALADYFWKIDNNGGKLVQLRFIDSSTIDPIVVS